MHITAALNVIRRELFRGNMYRGKYRFVKPVKLRDMIMLEEEYKREERVMKLLLNPYLSVEECKGHSEALGKQIEKYEVVREKRRSAKLKPNVHIEDRLVHLTTKDVWD